jgi:hypothetical protein
MLRVLMVTEHPRLDTITLLPSQLEERQITAGTIVRAMSPAGLYWAESIVLPQSLYVNRGDLLFIVCRFGEGHLHDNFYTDFDDPRVEECRVYAALMLPLGYDDGLVLPFPAASFVETRERFDLSNSGDVGELEALLRNELARASFSTGRSLVPPSPPCAGGPAYEFRQEPAPVELQRRIYDAIDVSDHLTMRGLSAYVRSQMLISRTTFIPEGLYTLFISLDATFSLVMRRLRAAGVNEPNAYDAQAFIEQAFGDEPSGIRYFENFMRTASRRSTRRAASVCSHTRRCRAARDTSCPRH